MTDHFDVVVIGDGLSGLLVADRLASDCTVARVGSPQVVAASERSSSIVACGAQDSPARLVLGMGEDRASQYWQWSAHSVSALFATAADLGVAHSRDGSWRLALDEGELDEWVASLTLLDRWYADLPRTWRSAGEEELAALGEGFTGGVLVPGDGVINPVELASALRRRLEGRADFLADTARVLPGSEQDGAKRVELGCGRVLSAETIVIAAGWNAPAVDSALREMVYPVRLQALRTEPLGTSRATRPVLARHRFESWYQHPTGELVFTGCRWAEQPEMGAGIDDAEDHSDAVLDRQREFIDRHLPFARGAVVRERWSGVAAWSCDGLPFVGTLPGNPRVSVLGGWGGAGLSLIAGAVQAVSDGILGRQRDPVPSFLQPRRML